MLVGPDQPAPIMLEDFLDVCSRYLTQEEYSGLETSYIDPAKRGDVPPKGLCADFLAWEDSLRNALARLRAESMGLDAQKFKRDVDDVYGTSAAASEAMGKQTPLEAEIFLDSVRWAEIDRLAGGHYFDMEFLQGYWLKLQILVRRGLFDEEKGFAAYRDIYSRILKAAGSEVPTGGNNG